MSSPESHTQVLIGVFLLAGFAAHVLGRKVHVPRVTLLLILGFLAGPSAFRIVSDEVSDWFPLVANVTLSIIGFQLGEKFLGKTLRATGKIVAIVSLTETLASAAAVFAALWILGAPLPLALLLAAIAPATAPAATADVVRESNANGPVTDTVLGVVAIDDAWGVILFSLLAVLAKLATGEEASWAIMLGGLREVLGGLLLGFVIGLPMAFLTGRIRRGELTIIETLGFVFLCSGLALEFELSHVLACLAMGASVSNFAKHHHRPFHAIEEIEQPFLIIFFLLAGFSFDIKQLHSVGWIGVCYIVARSIGKLSGAYFGAIAAKASNAIRRHVGFCLLPQAGVALGLALLVSQRFPDIGPRVLTTIVGTTILFELVGPIATRLTLHHAGEVPVDVERSNRSHGTVTEFRRGN